MTHPVVSVITPTMLHPDRIGYLLELWNDLRATATPWEWLIGVDGDAERDLPGPLREDPRVTAVRSGRHVGAASARNLALGQANGLWVASVDDDDRLPAGSLDLRVAAARERSVAWGGGLLADRRGDELTGWDCPAPRGRVAPGDLWRTWGAPDATFPLGPTTMLVETDLLRSVGGWQGLPQAEDFGMVMAVSSQSTGFMLDDVVYHYRKHTGQMMEGSRFLDNEQAARDITFERGRLLSSLGQTCRRTMNCDHPRARIGCAPATHRNLWDRGARLYARERAERSSPVLSVDEAYTVMLRRLEVAEAVFIATGFCPDCRFDDIIGVGLIRPMTNLDDWLVHEALLVSDEAGRDVAVARAADSLLVELCAMTVHPRWRRRGVALLLLDARLVYARERGLSVASSVWMDEPGSMTLWERFATPIGTTAVGTTVFFAAHPRV